MDKKSQYYTSPDNYSDLGQMRTFTNIDHDIKTKISTFAPETKEKVVKQQVFTKQEILCNDIFESGIVETAEFIEDYDKLLAKFGQERLRKGSYVERLHHSYGGEEWYKALHKLFRKHIRTQRKDLSIYLNKNYGY